MPDESDDVTAVEAKLAAAAERQRRRFGLIEEVAVLAADDTDGGARARVMADMDASAADWPA